MGRGCPRGCNASCRCEGWAGSRAASQPPAPLTQIRGATSLMWRSRLMSRSTNESVCYLNASSASRTAPGHFKETNEGNPLLGLAMCLAQPCSPGQLCIHRSNLHRLTTNIFADIFDLPGFLSKQKMKFLLLLGFVDFFSRFIFLTRF